MGQRGRSDADQAIRRQLSFSPVTGRGNTPGLKLKSIPVQSLANLVCDLFQLGWRYSRDKASSIDIWT